MRVAEVFTPFPAGSQHEANRGHRGHHRHHRGHWAWDGQNRRRYWCWDD